MLSQGGGPIVNNSSVEGPVGLQGTSAYAASTGSWGLRRPQPLSMPNQASELTPCALA
jgi:hypothetical protein